MVMNINWICSDDPFPVYTNICSSQYISIHYIAHWKLIQCYISMHAECMHKSKIMHEEFSKKVEKLGSILLAQLHPKRCKSWKMQKGSEKGSL